MTDYRSFIESYPDFPKSGVLFRDIFPLIEKVDVFRQAISDLAKLTKDLQSTKILSLEARGFIIGAALSLETGLSMIPARKIGKLPGKVISYTYELEYGTDTMQIPVGKIIPQDRVLLADDVLATGGTAAAAAKLVEMANATTSGLASLMELDFLKGRQRLEDLGIKVFSLIQYDS